MLVFGHRAINTHCCGTHLPFEYRVEATASGGGTELPDEIIRHDGTSTKSCTLWELCDRVARPEELERLPMLER